MGGLWESLGLLENFAQFEWMNDLLTFMLVKVCVIREFVGFHSL